MSKMSLTQLIANMQGKSLTYGWDALVLYDQRKTNELLFQLYVERINSENGYIEPLSMVAGWDDGAYKEIIHDLKLSAPRLSFENAKPNLPAKARLTLDMIGGMIVSARKLPGMPFYISRLLKILPVGGPQLWMDQPVTKAVVDGLGEVLIDLNNADNFQANFVLGGLAMEEVGARFKEYFAKIIPSDQKIFPLGRLDGQSNDILTPQNFQVRVMKSDPLALLGDVQYGDGAIMLFITLKGGSDGPRFPGEKDIYLIPTDGGGHKFTGTLLLSSRILMEKIVKPAVERGIGSGLALISINLSHEIAYGLKASAGGGNVSDNRVTYHYWQGGANWGFQHSAYSTLDPFPYDFTSGSGLMIAFKEGDIAVSWAGIKTGRCSVKTFTMSGPSVFDFSYSYNMEKKFSVALDPQSNYVVLGSPVTVRDSFGASFSAKPSPAWNQDGEATTRSFVIGKARALVQGLLNKIEIPAINTFLLRNLLFPGGNFLHLSEAFVPGDLALFGQVDVPRTSIQLLPAKSTVEAGSGFQFNLTPVPSSVTWTARDIDGRDLLPDVISSSGYFTAPSQDQLPEGFLTIVVTAQGTLGGVPLRSSALVVVVGSMILTNPLYDSCDPGETKQLSAESLSGGVLEWEILTPQWGSRLDRVEGSPNSRVYTAGGSLDRDTPFSLDKIEVKQVSNGQLSHLHILIHNQAPRTPLWISEGSDPATGIVQFELRGVGGPIDPARVTWKLLGGPGTFDERTGIYRQPESVAANSFIVVSGTVPDDFRDAHAVAAVPLPLSKYVDLLENLQKEVPSLYPPPSPPTGFRLEHNNYYPIILQWDASPDAVKYRIYRWFVPVADVKGNEYVANIKGYNRFHLRAVDAAGQLSERTPYVYFFPPGYVASDDGDHLAEQ